MVVLNRIYTRTGDDGTTALGSGERRPKFDLRVAAYGTVDETNAVIGVVRVHLKDSALDAMLGMIQNDLFDLGADLAVPQRDGKAERLRVLASQVERLERDIDGLNDKLAPLTSFVLPGGTPAAAYLHLARTICRRAERMMVELAARPEEPVSDAAIQYMNRLSDFLFVASRAANNNGAGDVLWVPGQNRGFGRFRSPFFAPRALTEVGRRSRFRAEAGQNPIFQAKEDR
jgi:cob(I)alamin adenosyltransferase